MSIPNFRPRQNLTVLALEMAPNSQLKNRQDLQMTTNGVGSHHRVQQMEMFQQKTMTVEKAEKFGQKTMVVGKEERSRRWMKLEALQHRWRLHCRSQPTHLAPVLALPISMQKRSQPTRMVAPALDLLEVALPIIMQKKGFLPGS